MNPRIRFEAAGDDSGVELSIFFETATFKGQGSAWFIEEQISNFAKAVSRFPLDAESIPLLAGGRWDISGRHIEQEHIRLSAMPFGARGEVELCIYLAVPSDNPRRGLKCSLFAMVKTEYAQLAALGAGLASLTLSSGKVFEMVFQPY